MRVLLYAPRGHDPQQPHDQDEVYFVVSGSGWFVRGSERIRFSPGSALFVAVLCVPARKKEAMSAAPAPIMTRLKTQEMMFLVRVLFIRLRGL